LNPAVLAVIVLLTAFVGLSIAGVIDPLKAFRGPQAPDRRGLVPVPSSAMNIPAYTKITRDHVWNAKGGEFSVVWLRPGQVPPDVFRTVNAVIGRVLDHDKPAGYVFSESDFLPKGTKPGLTAGIPPGKRAMRIPVDRIPGLIELQPGDRFDLVATQAIDPSGVSMSAGGLYGKQIDAQSRMMNLQRQATVQVVVQAGDVVEPMRTRQVPVANTSMTQGLTIRTKPVQEVVIAVYPQEVARLTEAMAVGSDIACVPRSGRPDDPHDSITPDSMPISPFGGRVASRSAVAEGTPLTTGAPGGFGAGFTSIETIEGSKRDIVGTPVKR
jgi:Flp pilus assembly protein CpaB